MAHPRLDGPLDEQATLLDLMARLSAERDPERLLHHILAGMRRVVGAEAGTIYVVEEEADRRWLAFRVSQNDKLGDLPTPDVRLSINPFSIAGRVVLTGECLNVGDACTDAKVTHNSSFDRAAGYETHSVLTVPLTASDGEVLGAVQLINCLEGDRIVPFDDRRQELARRMAGAAGIALVNARLSAEVTRLFDGFVRASVVAIEARDPTTSGHSVRVAALALGLAEAAGASGVFGPALPFDPDQLRTLEYAALLHDFGKIGVREEILVKAEKLHPWEVERLQARFEIIGLTEEVRLLRAAVHQGHEPAAVEAVIARFRAELGATLDALVAGVSPKPATKDLQALVRGLGGRLWTDRHGQAHPFLTDREIECLSLPYGSLTDSERTAMNEHARHTDRFLRAMPWGRAFEGLPDIAASHHEKRDGTGYPQGLVGDQIPLPSQMITVVDIYDALTASDRPYRKAMAHQRACDILWAEADKGRLDSRLVTAFVEGEVVSVLGELRPDLQAKRA